MQELKLGAINLEPKDVAYIRALMRLFKSTENLEWVFAEQPPYHALVTNRAGRMAAPSAFRDFAGVVLTLVDPPGEPELNTVAYPIHATQFRDWLKLRQAVVSVLDVDNVAPQRVPAPASVVASASAAPAATAAGRQPASAAPPAGAPAPATVAASAEQRTLPLPQSAAALPTYKLRRWPSADVLGAESVHIRIATLMSRNALSTQQLAALTGRSEQTCQKFVATLLAAGLLIEVAHAGAPAATMPVVDAPVSARRTGLMASLRRHLGL